MTRVYDLYEASTVIVEIDDFKKNEIIEALLNYYNDHSCWYGEVLSQDDNALIDAPVVLSEILDNIIQPKVVED